MLRTPILTRDQVPEKYLEAFDYETRDSGGVVASGPGSAMINSPEMRKRANHLVYYLRDESSLPKQVQELAMILTARAMDCQYIWYAHSVGAIIRQNLMHHIAVIAANRLMQCLGAALVPTTNHKQVSVLAKALVPHLLRRVAAFTMTFLPLHASFGGIVVIPGFLRLFARPKAHVRGDDGPACGVLFQDTVCPGKHIVRSIAFQVQKHKIHAARAEELITVCVVSGNSRTT